MRNWLVKNRNWLVGVGTVISTFAGFVIASQPTEYTSLADVAEQEAVIEEINSEDYINDNYSSEKSTAGGFDTGDDSYSEWNDRDILKENWYLENKDNQDNIKEDELLATNLTSGEEADNPYKTNVIEDNISSDNFDNFCKINNFDNFDPIAVVGPGEDNEILQRTYNEMKKEQDEILVGKISQILLSMDNLTDEEAYNAMMNAFRERQRSLDTSKQAYNIMQLVVNR